MSCAAQAPSRGCLKRLSLRHLVLVAELDLELSPGLCVFTGETGAGKSILLDGLGLALGQRAETLRIQPGAPHASATASFELPKQHPLWECLAEAGIEADSSQPLILRRLLATDGRSRAFINDQAVSLAFLRQCTTTLVDVKTHHDHNLLFDRKRHRDLLDAYGHHHKLRAQVAQTHAAWCQAQDRATAAAQQRQNQEHEQLRLQTAIASCAELDPQPEEIAALEQERAALRHSAQLIEALTQAHHALSGGQEQPTIEALLAQAAQAFARIESIVPVLSHELLDLLNAASAEIAAVTRKIEDAQDSQERSDSHLEALEERYFALHDLARAQGVPAADLHLHLQNLRAQAESLHERKETEEQLAQDAQDKHARFVKATERLSAKRQTAARGLDAAVAAEFPALRLNHLTFASEIIKRPIEEWNAQGACRITFTVASGQGAAGPLHRIASTGELARLLLALTLVLASGDSGPVVLVFDEVDQGVGGAIADAVGYRLAEIAKKQQVLLVTHSPQVAARSHHHWRVNKITEAKNFATIVTPMSTTQRRDEIARMLAGAEITAEAQAAASRLIADAHEAHGH